MYPNTQVAPSPTETKAKFRDEFDPKKFTLHNIQVKVMSGCNVTL